MYNANKIKTFTPILPVGQGPTVTNAHECVMEILSDLNEFLVNPLSSEQLESFAKFLVDGLQLNDLVDGEYTIFGDYKIIVKHMTVSEFEALPEFSGY